MATAENSTRSWRTIAIAAASIALTIGVVGTAHGADPDPSGSLGDLAQPVAATVRDARMAHGDAEPPGAPGPAKGHVHVLVEGEDTDAVARAVEDSGGTVQASIPGKVDATVPADQVAGLVEDPAVATVAAGQQYIPSAGTVTSEGALQMAAPNWHTAGHGGAGVNVAILDPAGFQGYAAELGDELPASVTVKNFCGPDPDVVNADFTADAHGTEIAAIVHDVAPDAGITLLCARNDVQGVQAQNYILGRNHDGDPANDIHIVNGSFGNPVAGRGDGSGPAGTLEGIVRTLRQSNVLYVASAGNEGDGHFKFAPAGPDLVTQAGLHLVPWTPNNFENGVAVPAGGTVEVFVKWDTWNQPGQDFDLYLVDTSGQILTGSAADQGLGAEPVEALSYTNNSAGTAVYYLIIDRYNATSNPRFDTYVYGAGSELVTAIGSISVPASSPYAIAVGATCVTTGGLEAFSSQGPTIDGRIKPDVTAPDGTSGQIDASTTPYGAANGNCTSGFTGTSASAPHVAGAAALLREGRPAMNATYLSFALGTMATDAGPTGADNAYGTGTMSLQHKAFGGPSVAVVNGQELAFVRGSDHALWQRKGDGSWVRLGGLLASDPEVTSMASGRLDVFVRGTNAALWHLQSDDGGETWLPWESLGGLLGSGAGAVSWGPDRLDVFVRGTDGALWHRLYQGVWGSWRSLGGVVTADPDVASREPNRLDVFVRGSDNALHQRTWNGTTWSSWRSLGGGLASGPGATSVSSSTIDVVVRGTDSQLWARRFSGLTWGLWTPIGGSVISGPDATVVGGQAEVVVTGFNAALWEKSTVAGIWPVGVLGWSLLGWPAFPIL